MSLCEGYEATGHVNCKNLSAATDDDLLRVKALVDADIAQIASQIYEAKARAVTLGEFSDPHWFSRAHSAKRSKGQVSQLIQAELGRRRAERKRINSTTREQQQMADLLKAIRQVLPENQVEMVLDAWRKIR